MKKKKYLNFESGKGEILVSLQQKNSGLEFLVKDSGIGINILQEHHHKLFDRFYQENVATPGTGIGLSICKTILEAHGGRIWVESEGKDKGSTFRFILPIINEKESLAADSQINGRRIRKWARL